MISENMSALRAFGLKDCALQYNNYIPSGIFDDQLPDCSIILSSLRNFQSAKPLDRLEIIFQASCTRKRYLDYTYINIPPCGFLDFPVFIIF